jgi:hypothetical protein
LSPKHRSGMEFTEHHAAGNVLTERHRLLEGDNCE